MRSPSVPLRLCVFATLRSIILYQGPGGLLTARQSIPIVSSFAREIFFPVRGARGSDSADASRGIAGLVGFDQPWIVCRNFIVAKTDGVYPRRLDGYSGSRALGDRHRQILALRTPLSARWIRTSSNVSKQGSCGLNPGRGKLWPTGERGLCGD